MVEIAFPGSKATDAMTERGEYAAARIPRYRTVGRDTNQTVMMYQLVDDGYQILATTPLAWVLNTTPDEYFG